MNEFYLTQSALKDLEAELTCPFRWKAQWIDKQIKSATTEATDRGSYFELGVLGSGAIPGAEITDLPRLKNGDKSADHKRIDEQIERVRGVLFDPTHPEYLGLTVSDTQVHVKSGKIKGTYDIVANDGTDVWIIDLKLTKDATNAASAYGYGNEWEDLDLIQLIHYQDLFHTVYGVMPKVGLLVADYSPQKNLIFGEIKVSKRKRLEKTERFDAALTAIDMYNERGWVKTPHPKECANCPLKCEQRALPKLVKKVINY